MREIVKSIGTAEERARTELLLGSGSPEIARQKLQELSHYAIPASFLIPIRIVNANIDLERLDPLKKAVAKQLTAINQSVFLYGWLQGWTTVSSNKTVAKVIEGVVGAEMEKEEAEIEGAGNGQLDGTMDGSGEKEGLVGPEIWLCETARSLVGKEKGRRT